MKHKLGFYAFIAFTIVFIVKFPAQAADAVQGIGSLISGGTEATASFVSEVQK